MKTIYVRIPCRGLRKLVVKPDDTIGKIKEMIQKVETNLQVDKFELVIDGKGLPEDVLVESFETNMFDINEVFEMYIYVNIPNGQLEKLTIDPGTTVSTVKRMIQKAHKDFHTEKFKLVIARKCIPDDFQLLMDFNMLTFDIAEMLSEESTLLVKVQGLNADSPESCRLFVTEPNSSVAKFQKMIHKYSDEAQRVPWTRLKLELRETVLQNDKNLSDYNNISGYNDFISLSHYTDPDDRRLLLIGDNQTLWEIYQKHGKSKYTSKFFPTSETNEEKKGELVDWFQGNIDIPCGSIQIMSIEEANGLYEFVGEIRGIDLFVLHPDPLKTNIYIRSDLYNQVYAKEKRAKFDKLVKALGVKNIQLLDVRGTLQDKSFIRDNRSPVEIEWNISYDREGGNFFMPTLKFDKTKRGLNLKVPEELEPWLELDSEKDLKQLAEMRTGDNHTLDEHEQIIKIEQKQVLRTLLDTLETNNSEVAESSSTWILQFHVEYYSLYELTFADLASGPLIQAEQKIEKRPSFASFIPILQRCVCTPKE